MKYLKIAWIVLLSFVMTACSETGKESVSKTAAEILGNPYYQAFSYGGYRHLSRDTMVTVEELREDMLILSAMGVKIIRTYNSQQYPQAANLLKAIRELKQEDPEFEMYVMIGAWIDCKGAWTDSPDHSEEDVANNSAEIQAAVNMAKEYPDIVKIIAVGNEAMVHWAGSYFVGPDVILKWVEHLQTLKQTGDLPKSLWITSSDNFASWGGGDDTYHVDDLEKLIRAVDYISLHTYPFHDSHYNPDYWQVPDKESGLTELEKINAAMLRATNYAISQYQAASDYISGLGIDKPIHIGETGWSSVCGSLYGKNGSRAADEYKGKLYYDHIRKWTDTSRMSCFYFEAFDEKWKDTLDVNGSENHFGLINLEGQAKYALWHLVDQGIFEGLSRDGFTITKSYDGNEKRLLEGVLVPPEKNQPPN